MTTSQPSPPHWLVTGASGQLGAYLLRELAEHNVEVHAWSGRSKGKRLVPMDLADRDAVAKAFEMLRPAVVIHAAALSTVAECHREPDRASAINVSGSALLTQLSAQHAARLIHVSTDMVFDGEQGNYTENDAPNPCSMYGRTKAEAERIVLANPHAAVARLSLLFGPTLIGRSSFFDGQLTALRERKPMPLFVDEWRTPLSLRGAARALIALAKSDFTGRIHLGGPERMSRLEMGQRLAAFLKQDASVFVASRRDQVPAPEPRPRDTSLDSSRWRQAFPTQPWPGFEEALREMSCRAG
ncbi:MAG: SDR family oxidoreductase [Gemmataceae bacterium]|nr:SDR family oxidoreductase [Gemmataceae bacterium]